MNKKIGLTEVVLRDGNQSLLSTRLKIDDLLPIASKLDQIGYSSIESWGGAVFDSCVRYLNEDPWEKLIRELKEELNIETKGTCLAPLSFASHQYENFHLLMPLFICRRWWGDILALESQEMRWVWPKKLREFDMPPADEPLVSMLRDFL